MIQIKTFKPTDGEDRINEFLSTIETEDVIRIDVRESGFAVIQYEKKEAWSNRHCCDCKYWDDGGDTASVGGLCIECGQIRRFNCKACNKFHDYRD